MGGAAIGLAIVLAPETGGGSLAALGVAAGVLGGTAEVGNGIVDIAHGAGQVDAQTAEEAKQGINIANNAVAANALIVTNANNAERIGNVANGIVAAHDLATRPEGAADPRPDPGWISGAFRSRFRRRFLTGAVWRFGHGEG